MNHDVVKTNKMSWVLDPNEEMLGPLKDGGTIIALTSPGCWGPMITPDFASGHETTKPVYIEGAEVGDAVALYIKDIKILAKATVSGIDEAIPGFFNGDPFVAPRCPVCDVVNPKTYIEGTGEKSIRCAKCHNPVTPFRIKSGYTMVFDDQQEVGITVGKEACEDIAKNAYEYAHLPVESKQYPANLYAKCDLEGVITRMRPMIGNMGSCPSTKIPSSHNAGDFGAFLVGAPHEYGIDEKLLLQHKTDGHMDADEVRKGAILIVPVKVKGAGIYIADVHAMQGDGEIAGHTTDVSAEVTLKVELIKGLKMDGPILLPNAEDLPFLARPYDQKTLDTARALAKEFNTKLIDDVYPMQVIGTGANMDAAVNSGLQRMADLLGESVDVVRNRVTISGSVSISRMPGVAQITALVPASRLKELKIEHLYKGMYR
jgi:formamidase